MQTEETKNNGTEDGCSTFGCCDPEEFKKMFEKKCRCLSGQSDSADFSAMKEGMMKKMMEILPEALFYRIHKSYIISLDKMELVEGNTVLVNKKRLPIGNSYRQQFMDYINDNM